MKPPKISVIIPIYNVEAYLRRCIDSVVDQTYRNMEIILVDDGSTDDCGAICDEYAFKDNRIRTVHKENGGVSSARNIGLSIATGDYVGWVDSDDWIEPDMFEYMLKNAEKENADIAVCGRYECYRDKSLYRGWPVVQTFDTEEALQKLFENDIIQNFLWDKLTRRDLFASITFPEGRTYEDIAVVYKLFLRAKKLIFLPEAKYHYVQRQGSIVDDISLKNKINHYISAKERYEEVKDIYPQYGEILSGQCVASAVGIWCAFYRNPKNERDYFAPQLREIAVFSRNHKNSSIRHIGIGITGRAVVKLVPYAKKWAFAIAGLWSVVYSFKHGKQL